MEEELFRKTSGVEDGLQISHKVKLCEPASTLSEEDATAKIRNLLMNVGRFKSVWLHEDPKSPEQQTTATYRHEKDALAAVEGLTGKVAQVGKLEIQGITKIKYNVPKKIADSIWGHVLRSYEHLPELDQSVIRLHASDEDVNKPFTTIRIEAVGRRGIAIASQKRAVWLNPDFRH